MEDSHEMALLSMYFVSRFFIFNGCERGVVYDDDLAAQFDVILDGDEQCLF